ncbi:MAG: hypothetical protein PVF70_01595 [Anaerolineales bacterium]
MSDHACPICSEALAETTAEGVFECQQCGAQLALCPICNQPNALESDRCLSCKEPLTTIGQVLSRHTADRKALFLEQARYRANAIKQSEAAASERRLTRLYDIDSQRERTQAKASQEAKAREKSMLSTTLAVAAVFILAIVIATLIIALRG